MGDFSKNIHAHIKFALLFTAYLAVSIFLIYTSRKLWIVFTVVIGTFLMKEAILRQKVIEGIRKIASGEIEHWIQTKDLKGDNLTLAQEMNHIGDGIRAAVDANVKNERLKTDLITNVSHDIKTPLTSIINYADLICEETNISDSDQEGLSGEEEHTAQDFQGKLSDSEGRIREYAEVLLRQSRRLKKLLEDLVEASKATTGNLEVDLVPCQAGVILTQAVGEYQSRMEEKGLELIARQPQESVRILADGRHLWRVFDNLLSNTCKYAQEHSRVYLSVEEKGGRVLVVFRNMSKYPLEMSGEELEERFVRGDRSRHMEGNGLGLSIAKSLVELQGGRMEIVTDGDLFKVILSFAAYREA